MPKRKIYDKLDNAIRQFYPLGGVRLVNMACPGFAPWRIQQRAHEMGVKMSAAGKRLKQDTWAGDEAV